MLVIRSISDLFTIKLQIIFISRFDLLSSTGSTTNTIKTSVIERILLTNKQDFTDLFTFCSYQFPVLLEYVSKIGELNLCCRHGWWW